MKVLLAVLLISSLQIELKCDENSKLYIKSKNGKPLEKSIKLLNLRKFGLLKKGNEKEILLKKHDSKLYTVFPPQPDYPIGIEASQGKSSVKKVLAESEFSRVKRSLKSITGKGSLKAAKSLKGKLKAKKGPGNLHQKSAKSHLKKRSKLLSVKKGGKILGNKNARLKKIKKLVRSSKKSKNKMKRIQKSKRLRQRRKNKKTNNNIKPKVRNRRMIAARDAKIEDYPYMVSIQKNGVHWCSGALLNQRLVITTANCIWKSHRISRLRIRAGSRFYDRGGQTAKIQEVAKHPKWSIRSSPDYDIALLLLDRFLKFSESVHSVDLPNKDMMPPFSDAWITSWGSDRRDGIFDDTSQALQVYHAQLMDRQACNNVTLRFGVFVTKNFICFAQAGRRAPCTRDTGAPAVSDGIVWGLASWGIRKLCGTERFPAMFSYVASAGNLDFIARATSNLMSEQRFNPYPDRMPYSQVLARNNTT